jgi:hypothetical protein
MTPSPANSGSTPAPVVAPAPTAQHHARLNAFLAILERLGLIALQLAPAIAAPFVGPQATAIIAAEGPPASAIADALLEAAETAPNAP